MLFKITGLLIIFLVCSMAGIIKASGLKSRSQKLMQYYQGALALAERIRVCEGEIIPLVKICFNSTLLTVSKDKVIVEATGLKKEDTQLLNEFFNNIGMSDQESQYKRTRAFAALLKEKYSASTLESQNLCRLYQSLGVLCGIFLCIFFL